MDKELIKVVDNLKGSLLGIGLENEKIIDKINNNDKILTCFLLENNKAKKTSKLSFAGHRKKVNIKKLKKVFGKKRLNTVICNFEYAKKFMRHFILQSTLITKDNLYLYGKFTEEELEIIQTKYQRYTNDIIVKKINDDCLIKINLSKAKNKFWRDKIYYFQDLGERIIDILTNLLIN